jgi:hypothetical protein
MSGKPITMEELAAIFLAGGRNRKEKSNAQPQSAYKNPLDSFEYPSERARKEEIRRQKRANRKGRK